MSPSRKIIDVLLAVAQANRNDPLRNGQMLCFPGSGDLVVAGDLHNHHRNFERIVKYASLEKFPNRHLILQELIHGGPLGPAGEDTSLDILISALSYAQRFPGRVHFLLANHDLAQVQELAVMKDGYDLTERFTRHIDLRYGRDASSIHGAFREYMYSQILAAITVTGIFFSHSLPSPRDLATFDATLLRRPLLEADYLRNAAVYKLIWGRHQNAEVLTTLARTWWTELFVCGHQQQEQGFGIVAPNMLIIDSSHNHGVLLHVDLSRQYTLADLTALLRPLAAIA